jgi:hypothetical protein
MLSVLDTINSRLQNADNSLVQNTANNSEQQDPNSSEKINAAKTAFGRELSEAEKSTLAGLASLPEANQWIEQQGLNWAKQNAAEKAFGRGLSEAEKSAVQGLNSLLEANQWIEQQGLNWAKQNAAEKAFGRGLSEAEKSAVQGLSSLPDVNAWTAQKGQEWKVAQPTYDPGRDVLFQRQADGNYLNLSDKKVYSRDSYLQNANTKEAAEMRGLLPNIAPAIASYIDPASQKNTSKDLSFNIADNLRNQGITDLSQIQKNGDRYINKVTGKEINPVLFDDGYGNKVLLGENGIKSEFNAKPISELAKMARASANQNMENWFQVPGMSLYARDAAYILENLDKQGVRSWASLQWFLDEDGKPALYDKSTLKKVDPSLGGVGKEVLGHDLFINPGEGGVPVVGNYKIPTKKWYQSALLPVALFALTLPFGGLGGFIGQAGAAAGATAAEAALIAAESGIAAGGLGAGVGTGVAGALASAGLPATAANIGGNALVHGLFQGTVSDLQGGNFGKGFGIGALTGGLGSAASGVTNSTINALTKAGLDPVTARIAANSLTSAGIGGTLSAAQGKGFLPGAKTGAISGGIGAGVNELGNVTGLNKGLGSLSVPARSLATSALVAKAMNRPFDFGQAAQNAAINYGLNQAGQAAGFTPSQQKALISFLKFAAPMIAARR